MVGTVIFEPCELVTRMEETFRTYLVFMNELLGGLRSEEDEPYGAAYSGTGVNCQGT